MMIDYILIVICMLYKYVSLREGIHTFGDGFYWNVDTCDFNLAMDIFLLTETTEMVKLSPESNVLNLEKNGKSVRRLYRILEQLLVGGLDFFSPIVGKLG